VSRALFLVASLALILVAAPALADAPAPTGGPLFGVSPDQPAPPAPRSRATVRLTYSQPAGDACPDERALRGAVAARLGYDPGAAPGEPAPTLRVTIVRQAGGFVARAEIRDAAGRLTWERPALTDMDCRHLVDVLGLTLAIALDPGATGSEPPAPAASPPIVPELPPATPAPESPPTPPAPSARPQVRLGIRAGLAVATLPRPSATMAADFGVVWPYFSIAIEARADLPVTADVDHGARIHASILAASLVPCGRWRWLVACGVVSVGALRLAGVTAGVPANEWTSSEGSAAYFAAGPRLALEWPIPSLPLLALQAAGEVLVTVHPVAATRTPDGGKMPEAVWTTPPFAGSLGAGVAVRF
jgi:hypothetical protein